MSSFEGFVPNHHLAQTISSFDLRIPMRDGIELVADVHVPADATGAVPILLAFQPWGKDHEAIAEWFPPQRRPSHLWDGAVEGGDTRYLNKHGYGHIIVDARGTGGSQGVHQGMMGMGDGGEGPDLYDVVEWIAAQPWSDGNVGMIGISYLASVQILAAAEKPPHLKAIFAEGGHFDMYRHSYHGGILWKMPRAALRGRGGDSFAAFTHPRSYTLDALDADGQKQVLQEALGNPDLVNCPNYHQILKYPYLDLPWLDYLLNPFDGGMYWAAGSPSERLEKVDIPVHFGVQVGRGWQMDDTISSYLGVASQSKRLVVRKGPAMQERPFHEFHDDIVRWYDYWLKGIDNGVADEPPVQVFVEGANEWHYSDSWPLPGIETQTWYLRPSSRLNENPEVLPTSSVPPDGYYQAPERVTTQAQSLEYLTFDVEQPIDFVGPGALHFYASIDTDDANWFVNIFDVAPNGARTPISMGMLKASHRTLDEARSTELEPFHPHMSAEEIVPGEIYEYSIPIYPASRRLPAGHRLAVEIKSTESENTVNTALPPESGHLNSSRATTHKIYRDADHPSRLVMSVLNPAQ